METRPALSCIRATGRFNTYVHKAVLPVYECATFFSDLTASFLMTDTPVARSTWALHSVTTAKLPATRKDSTIASFSEATSWPSSTVPLSDVLIRKNRAVDGSASRAPRRCREPCPFFPAEAFGSAMLLAAASVVAVAIALLLVESSRPAGPKRLQAATRPLEVARLA